MSQTSTLRSCLAASAVLLSSLSMLFALFGPFLTLAAIGLITVGVLLWHLLTIKLEGEGA